MSTESYFVRFLLLIYCFLGSMFLVVFSSNLVRLLVGWDLLGFTSFFLVSFFGNRRSFAAALCTSVTNRLGDCFFFVLLGLSLQGGLHLSAIVTALLYLISMTKSAILPFSAWLPAAIYAPTPVSALVHSSTLVTAGIYLLFRFSVLPSQILVSLGILTSLLGGLAGSLENDSKKIIAFSTLSQLGLIITGLGLGLRNCTFNHILSHAIIKATLFLAVGVVIHSQYGSQELRSCSALSYASPATFVTLAISYLGLRGITFTSGYFTKDKLLEAGFCNTWSLVPLVLFYLSIGLTVSYLLLLGLRILGLVSTTAGSWTMVAVGTNLKAPMLVLVCYILYQAQAFRVNGGLRFSILTFSDKCVIYFFLAVGCLIGYIFRFYRGRFISPFEWVSISNTFSGSVIVPLGSVLHCEVKTVIVFGVGSFFKMLNQITWARLISPIGVLCLFLIMCTV